MSMLFEPVKIRNLVLRNRFVRSATGDGCADRAAHITDRHLKMFAELADGGVGLIIMGITYVHPSGRISWTQSSIADDDCLPGLKRLTSTVHERGAKIAVQLFHGGRESAKFLNGIGKIAKGPSVVEDDPYFSGAYSALTEEDIRELVAAFGDAAARAKEAGFDAVQLHGAHAYLLSQFLSPFSNQRTNGWGGSLEKRLRFHREVYQDIRRKAGPDFPVLSKLGVQDGFPGGLELAEGIKAARLLADWGYDALEISQGLRGRNFEGAEFKAKIDTLEKEAYFTDWAREIKKQVAVPVMAVGGFRTFSLAEGVVQKGQADFIALCRPLLRQPNLVKRWEQGSRDRATCISCNECLAALRRGEQTHCVYAERKMA